MSIWVDFIKFGSIDLYEYYYSKYLQISKELATLPWHTHKIVPCEQRPGAMASAQQIRLLPKQSQQHCVYITKRKGTPIDRRRGSIPWGLGRPSGYRPKTIICQLIKVVTPTLRKWKKIVTRKCLSENVLREYNEGEEGEGEAIMLSCPSMLNHLSMIHLRKSESSDQCGWNLNIC